MLVKPYSFLQRKVAAAPAGGIVTTNLRHNYDGNNASSYPGSGTVIYDLQGNADMDMYGTTAWGTYGGINNVFNIPNASNSWIGITSGETGIDITNGISMEMWMQFPAYTGADWFYSLFNGVSSGPNRQMFRMEPTATSPNGTSAYVQYDGYVNNANTLSPTKSSFNTNTWWHVVGTYTPGALGWYVNNVSAGTPTNFTAPTTHFGTGTTLRLWLSRRDDRTNDNFGMICSEWRFYDKALTQAEITQNWDATKARYGY